MSTWVALDDTYAASIAPNLPPGVAAQVIEVDDIPFTVIRREADTVAALGRAGHDIAPSEAFYDYPGRFSPMAHQRAMVRYMLEHKRVGNISDPGTGKTLAAVWAADALMTAGLVRRVLIVAPKTILNLVWARELFSTLPGRHHAVLQGTAKKKQAVAADTDIPFIIVNYESLHIIEGHLPEVDLVIADEATKAKEPRAKRTQALQRVAAGKRYWPLTGTPSAQAPTDAYMICRMLRTGNYMSFSRFKTMTMVKVDTFKWVPRSGAAGLVARELKPAIRFSRDDCLDLPAQQVIDLEIEPTEEQRRLALAFAKAAWASVDGRTITAANAGVAQSKALQVLTGGVYYPGEDGQEAATVDATPLMETIKTIVEQTTGPVIVFAPFRISAAAICAKMISYGLRAAEVTGGTPMDERVRIFDAVQASEIDVVVATPQTTSHGLTLTASNTIIWAGPIPSYETYDQANQRINRTGQKRKTVVYRIVQTALTARRYRLWLDDRAATQDALLALMEEDTML